MTFPAFYSNIYRKQKIMIHYFIKNGKTESGPFTVEQLKNKSVTQQTPIWFAGLEEWTIAGEVYALRGIFEQKDCESKFSIKAIVKFLNGLFKKREEKKTYQFLLSKERNNLKKEPV